LSNTLAAAVNGREQMEQVQRRLQESVRDINEQARSLKFKDLIQDFKLLDILSYRLSAQDLQGDYCYAAKGATRWTQASSWAKSFLRSQD
jgi:hypothetical protein